MSVSRLCFLLGGLALRCTCEGLFPCFSADCLSGEIGVKKIKFFSRVRVHGTLSLKTVKLWVVFLTKNLAPTNEGKPGKADGLEGKH